MNHIATPIGAPIDSNDAPLRTHTHFEAPGTMPLSNESMARTFDVMRRTATLRSTPMNVGITGTWWFFRELVRRAQAMDDRLHPEWRATPVERPVFIFASARSGTTMLHRLLALDEERWATIKLYQTIFPTVTAERIFERIREASSLDTLARAVPKALDATFFDVWKGVHPLSLDVEEEDECLFVFAGSSPTLTLLLPFADELAQTCDLDMRPLAEREAFLDYYEGCLRRFLHSNGAGRRLLNKNVFLGPRLRSLAGRFTDAQFVFLVRHPYESLGSYLSMWHRGWAVHRPEIAKDSDETRAFARMALRHYRDALASRSAMGDRLLVVRYDDLARDPERAVKELYSGLGEPVTREYREELRRAADRQKDYRSEHAYALEEFGIDRDFLYREIPEVYAEFGFAR